MRFLGVRDYAPRHVEGIEDLGHDRERLRSLAGATLVHHHAMWDDEDDTWFTDGPFVLDFGSCRLELAAFKLHLCVSWDSIDLEDAVDWYGAPLSHVSWHRDPFGTLLDSAVSGVVAVEYRGGLNGFGFAGSAAYFELFNALDELGLRRDQHDYPEVRRTAL
jgi:hypothetical protein